MKYGLTWSCLFLMVINSIIFHHCAVMGYPMIIEVEANSRKCFNYNIPEDDDATFVVVAIPGDSESKNVEKTQDYYTEEFIKISNMVGDEIPEKIDRLPDELEGIIANDLDKPEKKSKILFSCAKDQRSIIDSHKLEFYRPHIVKYIVDQSEAKGFGDMPPMDGYIFCYKNSDREFITLIFDIFHWNDEGEDDRVEKDSSHVVKKEHITPLESNFKLMVKSTLQIVNEMKYEEKRVKAKTKKDDRIRSIVTKFSYLSVGVLIGTAWVQIMYLKRYFKKKKLL